MKRNSMMKWLLIFAVIGIALAVGFHFLHMGGYGQRTMAGGTWQNGQGFHHVGFNQNYAQGGQLGGRQGMGPVHGFFGIGSILFALFLAGLGWLLRKNAGQDIWKKWAGWVLIAIGAMVFIKHVIPLLIFIIAGIVIWKLVTRKSKQPKDANFATNHFFDSFATTSNKTGSILDEWERNHSKEDK